ncbi:MAG TPA: sensor histidine kinase [Planosporangium sp.]|nr:sensor histidine kinase [Planosporangium sp.]
MSTVEVPGVRLAIQAFNAVLDAALRTPVNLVPAWPWPARPTRLRLVVSIIWAVLAAGCTASVIAELIAGRMVSSILGTLIGVAQCVPLLLAVRRPLVAWRIMVLGLLAGVLVLQRHAPVWPWPVGGCLAMVLVLFQVAASYQRRTVIGVGLLTALVMLLPAVPLGGTPPWLVLILCGVVALVLVLGDAILGRRTAEARLAEHAELRRQDLARQAVLEERSRIARELHDVVAHHMSMIAIQAEAAPLRIADLPPAARETLAAIRSAAREALAETRRVVGLLRNGDELPERVPQPGLDRLDELLDTGRQSGLTVEPLVVGVPRPLAVGVDLSAYRIVQEALSNAARYAPGARVRVAVRYGGERLRVSVTDDGCDPPLAAQAGGGHGLVGMRERVAMLGGTLSAGPHDNGGFAVVADLPYGAPSPA